MDADDFAYTYLYEVCKKNIEEGNADVFNDPVAAKSRGIISSMSRHMKPTVIILKSFMIQV